LEEYHPEQLAKMKDSFVKEFYDLVNSHPNEIFFMSRESYLLWRVNKWRRKRNGYEIIIVLRILLKRYKHDFHIVMFELWNI
jgi:hypothetical protein